MDTEITKQLTEIEWKLRDPNSPFGERCEKARDNIKRAADAVRIAAHILRNEGY